MKLNHILFASLAAAASVSLFAASDTDPVKANANAGVVQTATVTSAQLKDYTFEQRVEFGTRVKSIGAQFDAAVGELNAGYNEMLASPARRAAMEALRVAAADFKNKTSALDNMTAETW